MKTFKIRAFNTVEREYYEGEFDGENERQAKEFAKIDFCFPPSSHIFNVKIKSCIELLTPTASK